MKFPRSAGILLHISSLPGPYGIGDLGLAANNFASFLKEAGQTIWQILPLCPPANGNSPYSSYSAFATNSNLISPDKMIQRGWGSQEELDRAISQAGTSSKVSDLVDFESAISIRKTFFDSAFATQKLSLSDSKAYQEFSHDNAYWLDDFALFESIARVEKQFDWTQWPTELAHREQAALVDFEQQHSDEVEFSRFLQFVFETQWKELKQQCNKLNIRIYGDLPIFVDHQSADVWANQKQFQLDDRGKPEFVAGVPPDYFSPLGQKWGNPLYRWDVMEQDGYTWWNQRFRRALEQFDIIRVDHFRGFEAYYQIPADAPSAKTGSWIKGPGAKPFLAAERELGDLPIVAEDLGLITKEVDQLRDELEFPTMRVMQFGYGSADDNFHRPDHYPDHCFAYTGTHDNETIMGWYQNQMENEEGETRQLLSSQFGDPTPSPDPSSDSSATGKAVQELPVNLQMIEAVLESNADTAIIPLQDYLGLNNDARMNIPATVDGNWQWKLQPNQLEELAPESIREMAIRSQRLDS